MFLSIIEAVSFHSQKIPDKLCIIDSCGSYSYSYVWKMINCVASCFIELGIKKQDRIVIECTQDARYLILGLACQRMGAIFVPLEKGISLTQCKRIISDVDAFALISESDYNVDIRTLSIEQIFGHAVSTRETVMELEVKEEDIAEILYTTGTTGNPKGIIITNKNNVAVAENIKYGVEMKPDNVELIPLLLSHSHGLRTCYANLLNGSTVVISKGITMINEIVAQIENQHVTSMDLSPSAAKIILKLSKGYLAKYAGQIDYIELGTAILTEEIKEKLIEQFPKSRLYNFYGSTEAGRSCILDFNKFRGKKWCIGYPTRNAKFTVVDRKRCAIKSSSENVGFLAISGTMTTPGYWNDSKTAECVLNDEGGKTIYTKDIGFIDTDGLIFMFGRSDDVINCNGVKISPDEIEECALKFTKIADCACVPVSDAISGQVPKLFVQLKENVQFEENELINFLLQSLDSSRLPKDIEVIAKIPRASNGKIQRTKLMC